MDKVRFNPRLEGVVPYDPKYLPAEHLLSANESPNNVPDDIRYIIRKKVKQLNYNRYPDPLANNLRDIIAQNNGLERENILVGNGGDELLFNLALAFGGPGRSFLNLPPTFSVYETNAMLTGTTVVNVPRLPNYAIDEIEVLARLAQGDIDYVVIASPNNPTGQLASDEFVRHVLEATDALVMVDEAYAEFSRTTCRPLLANHKNLVILRTFSKAFSCAGVRLGYLLAHPEVVSEFIKVRQPYSVDAISQLVGESVFEQRSLFSPAIDLIISERDRLLERLKALPNIKVFPSDANFILVRTQDAHEVWQELLDRGILVRDFSGAPMLENCLRLSVGSLEENDALLTALEEILSTKEQS